MAEEIKNIDRRSLDRADQLREADKPKPPRKEGKSPFDEMLDQNRLLRQSTLDKKSQNKAETRQAMPEVERQMERQREQAKEREKEEEHKQESRDERRQAEAAGKKVVGKAGLKEQKGESGGHGFEGGGSGQKKSGRQSVQGKKEIGSEEMGAVANKAFAQAFQKALAQSAKDLPKTLPQEVLNQVVRHVRVGLNRQGEKEIELDLHQNVFKGLRLRFHSNHGRVNVHFLAANEGVKRLFEREAPRIRAALEGKGIAVETIQVT